MESDLQLVDRTNNLQFNKKITMIKPGLRLPLAILKLQRIT